MPVFKSDDGTEIAYSRAGSGPALVLVDGAMCYRGAGPMDSLAEALREHYTVYTYDRRGRGESSDTLPYAPAREVEDLRGLIKEAGSEAYLYGISSGAALSLAVTAAEPGIKKLAIYEPPFMAEISDGTRIKEYSRQLGELLDAGRKGDAVALFMTNVGIPQQVIAGMRAQPSWAATEAIAPTLAYDDAVLAGGSIPRDLAITVPLLVMAGSASPDDLQKAAKAAADAFPTAEHRVLEGETHAVTAEALAPVLREFFRM